MPVFRSYPETAKSESLSVGKGIIIFKSSPHSTMYREPLSLSTNQSLLPRDLLKL